MDFNEFNHAVVEGMETVISNNRKSADDTPAYIMIVGTSSILVDQDDRLKIAALPGMIIPVLSHNEEAMKGLKDAVRKLIYKYTEEVQHFTADYIATVIISPVKQIKLNGERSEDEIKSLVSKIEEGFIDVDTISRSFVGCSIASESDTVQEKFHYEYKDTDKKLSLVSQGGLLKTDLPHIQNIVFNK